MLVMRGFYVRVPSDAVAGISKEKHDFALHEMGNVLGVRIE
jgi:nicotinamidase-related amidase